MPTVGNRHHYRDGWPPVAMYVGRPGRIAREVFAAAPHVADGTALGNPFTRQQYPDAGRNLAAYRKWLWAQIQAGNAGVLAALDVIEEKTVLVCSCHPNPCHANVILDAWYWRRRNLEVT